MPKLTERANMIPIDRKCMEKGISRRELARRSGVPSGTLEAWGNRTRVPRDVYQLLKVAQVLECHIEDLIEPEANPDPDPQILADIPPEVVAKAIKSLEDRAANSPGAK